MITNRLLFSAVAVAGLSSTPAYAQTLCPSAAISNGTPADAVLVTNWFSCKAPTDSPLFTGKVGIGTTSPFGTLDAESATGGFVLVNTSATADGQMAMLTLDPGGAFLSSTYWNMGPSIAGIFEGTSTVAGLAFFTYNGTHLQAMRISAGGNVGIGTTTPARPLHVVSSASAAVRIESAGGHYPYVEFYGGVSGGRTGYIGHGGDNADVFLNSQAGGFHFQPNNGNDALTITTDGNVGIGTTSPAQLLTIKKDQSAYTYAYVDNNGTVASGTGTGLALGANGTIYGAVRYEQDGTGTLNIIGGGNGPLNLETGSTLAGSTPKLTILTGGNVGIGTTSPIAALSNTSASVGWSVAGSTFVWRNTAASGGYAASIIADPASGNSYGLRVHSAGATSSDFPLAISSGSAGTISLAVVGNGNVGVGTLSPGQALEVNGRVQVDVLASATSTNLCITATTYGVLASCSSSRRYKENIRSAAFGLNEVLAMNPVTFKWKGRNEQDFGLVAEEVAAINPLFVTYKNGKIEGVKYPQLVGVLAKAIQQQEMAIHRQEDEIQQLRTMNEKLATRLHFIESAHQPASDFKKRTRQAKL